MPVTKRLPHLGTPKNLIEYILDEKNDGEKVGYASSLNCNVETALYEFKDIQKKYKMGGTRSAYHIIQSFSPKDRITVEQANEIGLRMCKELYPNFQCIVSTHIDKGHIHNHICVNAINLDGRKLEDRLANEKEGLYGVSDTSDRIAAEYGCFIMPRKTYLQSKNSQDDYYQYKKQSWKEQIEEQLERLIPKCNSIDELLDELSILGYEIRRGKHISVKCLGMQRYARIDTINLKYSTSNLYKIYKERDNIKLLAIKTEQTEFNSIIFQKVNESKIAIEKSQLAAKGKVYSEYQKTKYQEIKRYYMLKKQLEYLDKYNIRDFEDIETEISIKRNQIKSRNVQIKKNQDKFNKILETTEMANDYIRLHTVYEYAKFYKDQDKDYILPKEAEIFLNIQKQLNITSIDEAKQIIKDSRSERININKQRKEVLELQRELNHLETIKEEKLSSSNLFIHNIKFGGNRIDYKNSKDKEFCVNLPYTNFKIHIDKRFTAYNEKHQFYTLYLVDDREYELYDENNEKVGNVTGIELEKFVLDKKKEIDSLYSK
ncbi:relaxase/mobilization nuclease domain-containing protein [uncultured Clostridium sp.]|uniref:relaxase/mobilization nuclease domain-containing protein n=1 Tax=uncultured Clostridium sp. TaxID=59620 RepID=UPI00261B8B5B|nr:relaxase/mobilization nuclease domain-containing protein [uncultured Clostridium sp.]MCI8310114.1 relaxase/mobilization nuclease domain-containing protein [Clostridia bacterium]